MTRDDEAIVRLNSFDEWLPLVEVIVGSAENYLSHERELSFDLFFHDNIAGDNSSRSEWYYPRLSARKTGGTLVPIRQRYVAELNEDLAGFAKVLESLSVTVHRPIDVAASTAEVRTPAWSASVVPPLNVRDNTLIAGTEIIETPPMIRSRYFETQLLKPIFAEYFRQGARWTVMPRPLMTDASFDLSYARASTLGGPTEPIEDPQTGPYDVGLEMMFDAAQCLRLGRDIVVNISTANRFRIHRVHQLSDSHIDSMVLALRPGTLLVRSAQVADKLPEPLRSWDLITAPPPGNDNFPQYADDLILASPFIDLNVLSVSPDTVLVNDACPELMKTLEQHKFTVIPVQRAARPHFSAQTPWPTGYPPARRSCSSTPRPAWFPAAGWRHFSEQGQICPRVGPGTRTESPRSTRPR